MSNSRGETIFSFKHEYEDEDGMPVGPVFRSGPIHDVVADPPRDKWFRKDFVIDLCKKHDIKLEEA